MPDVNRLPQKYYFQCKNRKKHIERVAVAQLPTRFGKFKIHAFCNSIDWLEHAAIVKGEVSGKSRVPVRIHSECVTGDALGSVKCDCRDQLEASLKFLGRRKCGVLLYMRQEGRGIGLINKVRAYSLQDMGYDTVEANLKLGLPDDIRDYLVASEMIKLLGIKSIVLISNNPSKAADLKKHGITVAGMAKLVLPARKENLQYLKTKNRKMGHRIELSDLPSDFNIKTKILE
ncbi:MAG: GTP cyclohydrolase II [Candidatus Micrarchaeia archaeon]